MLLVNFILFKFCYFYHDIYIYIFIVTLFKLIKPFKEMSSNNDGIGDTTEVWDMEKMDEVVDQD